MSVKVEELTKIYGEQAAVDHISFDLKAGEILGFLGPNGAGKSTTMKMITGYLPASNGQIWVCDKSVAKDPIGVKRCIGYLPEHNPLYLDMYVTEYLYFVAKLQGIKNRKSRVEEMIAKTGLSLERKKLIGSLSKGYRQRVGLAQAMLHDPKVLILDEPTSGLDPNQLDEIRALILELGEQKAVILSTHIMQEVQVLCDRVIIIDHGKLVADARTEDLSSMLQEKKILRVEFLNPISLERLAEINSIKNIRQISHKQYEIESDVDSVRIDIFNFAVKNNNPLLRLQNEDLSMEDVFRKLTKA